MSITARIDRIMRSPAAESAVPGAATAVTLALLLLHRLTSGLPAGERQSLVLAAVAAGTGGMARVGVWAWRRLWRDGDGEWEQVVHGRGVRHFGAAVAVLVPALTLASVPHEGGTTADAVLALLRLWTAFVCYMPLALWTGFWWGKVLAQWNGLREPGS
ncbi:MAG: hypothetical protein ACJ8AO_09505 [Gemmatimonadaceae bacterium]|jgi:hypothetical protein